MARISLDPPRTLLYRLVEWYSRRVYGDMLEPGKAMAHNPAVLRADLKFERAVAKFDRLDPVLKELAVMTAAARIGCSWCMDFGFWEGRKRGIPVGKLRAVPDWRQHRDVFTSLELDVLDYADAMCQTPPAVTDDMASGLLGQLGEAAMVELTFMVGLENQRSRVNAALGLHSQGFAERCELPAVASRS